MATQMGFEYPGVVYHIIARGDGGKRVFLSKHDHLSFLHWLEQVCASHGWRVHVWVLTDRDHVVLHASTIFTPAAPSLAE
jgi:REP element-mobilizing transposase RayT